MANVYQAPEADLAENTVPFDGGGSIENGIAGKYDFSIQAIISEAWDRTSGSKGTIWLALLFFLIVFIPVSIVVPFVLGKLGLGPTPGGPIGEMVTYQIVAQLLLNCVSLPLSAGLMMIGLKLAARAPVEATEIFGYFPKILPLLGTMILMYLMIFIGFCLFIIPGIYLAIAYVLAIPLVVEKDLSPWQALETSRKAITHRWFRVFGLYLVMVVIMIVAMIPLGIGLIWVFPMFLLAFGIVYRNIFGYDGAVAV